MATKSLASKKAQAIIDSMNENIETVETSNESKKTTNKKVASSKKPQIEVNGDKVKITLSTASAAQANRLVTNLEKLGYKSSTTVEMVNPDAAVVKVNRIISFTLPKNVDLFEAGMQVGKLLK